MTSQGSALAGRERASHRQVENQEALREVLPLLDTLDGFAYNVHM